MKNVLLASKSPRRIELLAGMGVEFDVGPADIDEKAVKADSPVKTVTAIAEAKAKAALSSDGGIHEFIIAADTAVEAPDGTVLGKPADDGDASVMLHMLSGTKHFVHTGIAVISRGVFASASETTAVKFLTLSDADISAYIATGEPRDKAGAYGIQERGGLFVEGIEGDYFNVMGLPLCRLNLLLLDKFGVSLTMLNRKGN